MPPDPLLQRYNSRISPSPQQILDPPLGHMINGIRSDAQRAISGLNGYYMVVSNEYGWEVYLRKWTHAVLVKCDVKPSQHSGTVKLERLSSHVDQCSVAIAHAWLFQVKYVRVTMMVQFYIRYNIT